MFTDNANKRILDDSINLFYNELKSAQLKQQQAENDVSGESEKLEEVNKYLSKVTPAMTSYHQGDYAPIMLFYTQLISENALSWAKLPQQLISSILIAYLLIKLNEYLNQPNEIINSKLITKLAKDFQRCLDITQISEDNPKTHSNLNFQISAFFDHKFFACLDIISSIAYPNDATQKIALSLKQFHNTNVLIDLASFSKWEGTNTTKEGRVFSKLQSLDNKLCIDELKQLNDELIVLLNDNKLNPTEIFHAGQITQLAKGLDYTDFRSCDDVLNAIITSPNKELTKVIEIAQTIRLQMQKAVGDIYKQANAMHKAALKKALEEDNQPSKKSSKCEMLPEPEEYKKEKIPPSINDLTDEQQLELTILISQAENPDEGDSIKANFLAMLGTSLRNLPNTPYADFSQITTSKNDYPPTNRPKSPSPSSTHFTFSPL